jgi:hypothetical protein
MYRPHIVVIFKKYTAKPADTTQPPPLEWCRHTHSIKTRKSAQIISSIFLHFDNWLQAGRSGDQIPVWARFSAPVQTGWGPPNLLYNGYQVFPEGKERPGHDADPPPPSSAVGHERVELYHYSPYEPLGLYRYPQCLYKGALYLYLLHFNTDLKPFI